MYFSLDTNLGGGYYEYMNKKAQGFTIVELLIVIVVIAILAAISIAAYTNIQQRAKNTAIINAASQSLKMIEAYIAANGTYPTKGNACITVDSGCRTVADGDAVISADSTFNTRMATIGTLPKSIPTEGNRWHGITYSYKATATFNGESQPGVIIYHLYGQNQQCGLPNVMRYIGTETYDTSPSGYFSSDSDLNKTSCRISIPGPAHS